MADTLDLHSHVDVNGPMRMITHICEVQCALKLRIRTSSFI